ncbi:ABC transporter ATP-binding protein [Lactobacillus sp. ESL0791]|uniref:ATP-binding cassette domain-containing protein n=1 Tax=Lactobacillus sp. ESL0791 TaxID=2983234 RepID=UPI0023F9C7FB|nr:ABC transporter ATP-binding protein [Lactobacillus sp. ESL0791]MDF7637913.1 ABC transporter ATP-binding protein [Lactobacillus sp. ESL0791]
MALKYAKFSDLVLYFLFSVLKALQLVFLALVTQKLMNWITKPTESLIKIVVIAVLGMVFFYGCSLAYERYYSMIVRDVNLKFKKYSSEYLIYNAHPEVALDTSFFTNDLKQVELNKVESELEIILCVIQFIAALVTALVSSIPLTLIFLVASFGPGLVQKLLGPTIERESQTWEAENSAYTEVTKETENIANSARIYNRESSVWHRFMNKAAGMETSLWQLNLIKGCTNETVEIIAYTCITLVPTAIGVYLVSIKNITLGTLVMISQLSNNFVNPLISVFYYLNNIKLAKPMWDKLVKIISKLKVHANMGANKLTFTDLSVENATVVFNKSMIFNNVSFTVTAGEKVLLMAPSGWGKTTLLNTLMGINQINKGSYQINGKNMAGNWQQAHNYFSYIQQDPVILNDTIKYNVTLGVSICDDQLNQIAKLSGLSHLIHEKGWNYLVKTKGSNLSGGQKQRIEIARALLANRPIILADEATSSLDAKLSKQIHNTLLHDNPGTVIEVAHHITADEQKMFDKIIEL